MVARRLNQNTPGAQVTFRSRAEVARFFTGLDLAEPGLVQPTRWRPDPSGQPPQRTPCGFARKPGVDGGPGG